MRLTNWCAAAAVAFATVASAQPVAPAAPLDGLSFLVGDWGSGRGVVADTGGSSTGHSTFTIEVGGHALLRRDHTDLFDAVGKPSGGFEQIMLIYPDAGTVHADYSDGAHVIHYASADIVPGRSVTFTSARQPGAPTFRLRYSLTTPTTLDVDFAVSPPGTDTFKPIATGSLTRGPRR